MTENKYEIHIKINKDRTEIYPYRISTKILFIDSEFKSRISKLLSHKHVIIEVESNKGDFLLKLFKAPIYAVKMFMKDSFPQTSESVRFFRFSLKDDLIESDIEPISFEELRDAEFVKEKIEVLVDDFLKEQERIFLSI